MATSSKLRAPFDPRTRTAFNDASLLFEFLCLVVEDWDKRSPQG